MIKNPKHNGLPDCDCPDCASGQNLNKRRRGLNFLIGLLVVVLVLGVAAWYSYDYYRSHYGTKEQQADYEVQKVVSAVSKLMVLPTDETPVLATISDVASLSKQQNFFVGAANGDKLLIYQKALKAIIWSPSSGRLVNVGPVVYDQNANKAVSPAVSNLPPVQTGTTTTSKAKKR